MKNMPGEAVGLLLVCKGSVRSVSYFNLLHYLFNLSGKTAFPVTASVGHEEY
jgi:hypothetical protein